MRNYIIYAVSMLLSLGFALLYHIIATHFMLPRDYGLLSIWLAPIIATSIFAVGYQQYVAREIAAGNKMGFIKEFLYPSILFVLLSILNKNFVAYIFLPFIFLLSYYRGILQNIRKFELGFNIFFESGLRVALLTFFIHFGIAGALLSFTLPFLLAAIPSFKSISFSKLSLNFIPFSLSMLLINFPTNFSLMIAYLFLPLDAIGKLAALVNLSKSILIISGSSFMEYLVKKTKGNESKVFPLLIIATISIPFIAFPQITRIFGKFYLAHSEFRLLCLSFVFLSILFLYINQLWSKRREKEAFYFLIFFLLLHLLFLSNSTSLLKAVYAYLVPSLMVTIAIILKLEILKKPCAI